MACLAFKRSSRGKLTFVRDPVTRDFVRDDRAVYPVLATLAMHKGAYFFDQTGKQGTLLYTVKTDRLTTGSRMSAYATDGMKQAQDAGFITSFEPVKATKLRTGSWQLRPVWQSPKGKQSEFLEI